MSENVKSTPRCLHCSVINSKYKYQDIYDELGIEIGLADLLTKYYGVKVSPNSNKSQLLCEACVNTLIQLYDIEELENERRTKTNSITKTNAVNALAHKEYEGKINERKSVVEAKAQSSRSTRSARNPPAILRKPVSSKPPMTPSLKRPAEPATSESASASKIISVELNIKDPKAPTALNRKTVQTKNESVDTVTVHKTKGNRQRVAAQISAMMRDILSDDVDELEDTQTVTNNDCKETNLQDNEDEDGYMLTTESEHDEADEDHMDENEYDTGSEDIKIKIVDTPRRKKITNITDTVHVLMPLKQTDNVGDLYKYLSTAVKTSFPKLTFKWATVCQHCTLCFSTFESLLVHMQKRHKKGRGQYKCPIEGCVSPMLNDFKQLAMHLVVRHASLDDVPIYGSCPECKMTFSNFATYNKHSCAHIFKKRRGVNLFCTMCSKEFISWKRYNFHMQFHLEKHRPRACFICHDVSFNIDDLFHHLQTAHMPQGTLFCNLCDRMFSNLAIFEEHRISHATVGNFVCSTCNATFETRGRLNGHIRIRHGSLVSCEICQKEFATDSTFDHHMKSHLIIERVVYICSNCGLLSENKEKLALHIKNKDAKACNDAKIYDEIMRQAYVCEYCSSYYKTKADLLAHRESSIHNDGLFWCHPCSQSFEHRKLYRSHIIQQMNHEKDTAHKTLEICLYFLCDYKNCNAAYANWNSLYTHKRRTHLSQVKPIQGTTKVAAAKSSKVKVEFVCQFCNKECPTKMSLAVHVARSHNNNNLVCKFCTASFKDEIALKKHIEYWHEPIKCPDCSKVVKNRRNYNTHVNVVHSNVKRYSCSVCGKGFYHRSEKNAHELLHSQSFKCNQCSFITRKKSSLDLHIESQHHHRYQFECEVCQKCFGRKQGLTTHMQRVHSEKYYCRDHITSGCGRSFTSTQQLTTHIRKSHNETIIISEDVELSDSFEDDYDASEEQQSFSKVKRSKCNKNGSESIEFLNENNQEIENDVTVNM